MFLKIKIELKNENVLSKKSKKFRTLVILFFYKFFLTNNFKNTKIELWK